MDASFLSPNAGERPLADGLRIDEVFPPYRLALNAADELARFVKPAAELALEPRQKDSFLLVAVRSARAVGYLKAQHGYGQRCWIRELAVDPHERRRGVGRALVRHGERLVAPHERLSIEVDERDDASHRFLAACGLECRAPWERTKRQRERRLYEFASYRPPRIEFAGQPRFTWPS